MELHNNDAALHIAQTVAEGLRDAIRPALDAPEAGDNAGVAASGDTTYSVDRVAEKALRQIAQGLDAKVACYSEDEGLHTYSDAPDWLLVVDPIDGTRPAASGFEACTVSVAVSSMRADARIGDVVAGAVAELRRPRTYYALRGGGAFLACPSGVAAMAARPLADFRDMRWTLETVARPARLNFAAAERLIDETSLRGALFALSSSAFSLCQVAAGHLSGVVDLSGRLRADLDPGHREFLRVGHGRVMGMWAYDIAAASLIASEAGCTVTDAWGNPLDSLRLARTQPEDMASIVCAPTAEHHHWIIDLLNEGFDECRRQMHRGKAAE